jgi:hypothetical protein
MKTNLVILLLHQFQERQRCDTQWKARRYIESDCGIQVEYGTQILRNVAHLHAIGETRYVSATQLILNLCKNTIAKQVPHC